MSVVVNGGGLVGALLAVYLRERGLRVEVYEKRSDLRRATGETGRSINLILTSRGLYALRQVGLEEAALRLCVPVRGRMMHNVDGTTTFQPYGISPEEVNYSVSRTALNALLVDEAEKRGARFHFEHDTLDIDLQNMSARYRDTCSGVVRHVLGVQVFIGTDGVASLTRSAIVDNLQLLGVPATFAADRLGISYKEITFPAGPDGKYTFDGTALHIWPRGPHFLMALADQGNTFTGTLYLPDGSVPLNLGTASKDVPRFEDLNDSGAVARYVDKYLPDVPKFVPNFADQMSRAHGLLATVRLSHWHYKGKALVLGDAAHGIVPFFGQGMNLGFESVVLLDRFMGPRHSNVRPVPWDTVFTRLTQYHQPSATAIANMAVENFAEMSYKVGQHSFLLRKALENAIETRFPSKLRSRYWMVTKSLIPYATVLQCGALVDQVLDDIIARQPANTTQLTLADDEVIAIIDAHVTPMLARHGIDLSQPRKIYYPDPSGGDVRSAAAVRAPAKPHL